MEELKIPTAVESVRKCSFNPQEYFIKVSWGDIQYYYLEVKWRLVWLAVYCRENRMSHAVIEEPATLLGDWIQSECKIFINGELIAKGVGAVKKTEEYAIQKAETIAKGRALANAGFGTAFASGRADESGGPEIPCESGIRVDYFKPIDLSQFPNGDELPFDVEPKPIAPVELPKPAALPVQEEPAKPVEAKQEEKPAAPVKRGVGRPRKNPAPAPAPVQATAPQVATASGTNQQQDLAEGLEMPKTREEALKVNLLFPKSKYYGQPLGEIFAKEAGYIRWLARNKPNADDKIGQVMTAAAKMILDF